MSTKMKAPVAPRRTMPDTDEIAEEPPQPPVKRSRGALEYLLQGFTELVGTLMFCFFSAGAVSGTGNIDSEALKLNRVTAIAISDGFAYYALLNLTMRLAKEKGGYLNPAVTVSLAMIDSIFQARKWWDFFLRALFYIAMQLGGALAGVLLYVGTNPSALNGTEKTGISRPSYGTTTNQAFTIEVLVTFFLVLVALSVRRHERRRSSFLVAFCYTALRLFSIPLSGGYANPARSFASGIVSSFGSGNNGFSLLWIYCSAPFVGGVVAVLVFLVLHKELGTNSQLLEGADGGL